MKRVKATLKEKMFSARLVGIALLIVAVVGYYSREIVGAIISLISGLILVSVPKRISQPSMEKFVDSFRLKKEFFFIALYDTLFYLSIFIVAWFFRSLTEPKLEKLGLLNLNVIATQEIVRSNASAMQSFFIYLLALLMASALLMLISYTLFKGLIWLTVLNKKPSFNYFRKLFLANTIWLAIWLIPGILALFGLKPAYFTFVFVIEVVLYLHLTAVLHLSFTKTLDIKRAYSNVAKVGFSKINRFIIPYIYALILYLIVSQVFRIIPQQQKVILSVAIIFALFYLAWFRYYIKIVIEGIAKSD